MYSASDLKKGLKIEIDGDTASVTVSDGWGNLQVIEMQIPPE